MAEHHKIDYEKLANDRLSGRTGRQSKDYGFKGTEHTTESKAVKFSNTAEKVKPSAEKRKVKNQAEIDRVKRENERIRGENEKIESQRKEIAGAVDGALDLVARKLSGKNLSEKDRARLTWVKNSTKGSLDKLERGKYVVEIKEGEKVVESRSEGLPTEALVDAVADKIQDLRRNVREIERIQQLKDRADKSNLDETSKKREWHRFLEELPSGKLKKRIVARVEGWKQADEAQGIIYDKDKMEQQLGEACFEVLKEYSQDQIDRLKKLGGEKSREIGRLEKILNTLDGASDKYFFHHYKKLSSELSQTEQQLQDKYTKREANYIATDNTYRDMLLEDFSDELPKGFDRMGKLQQDYELAMLALDNRLILNMPRKKKELEEPAPQYEEVPMPTPVKQEDPHKVTTPEPPKPVPVKPNPVPVKEHSLQNTNQPYDLENLAMSIPEQGPPSPPEKQDRKLFLIDISEIAKRMAWTKAEELLKKEYEGMGRFKRALKGLTENKRRIEYYQKAKDEIENDNNLMRAISERVSGHPLPGNSPAISADYLKILDSVVAEYKYDVVDTQREVGDSLNNNSEVQQHFAELLYRFRTNKWEGAQYNGLDKRAAVELFVKEKIAKDVNDNTKASWTKDVDRMREAKGLLYASNFYEILESVDKNYKDQIDAAVKGVMEKNPDANIEFIREAISKQVEGVQGLNLQLGLRDRDVVNNRPKGILKIYERLVDWGENHKVLGRIVLNPFVLGAASAVASKGVQRAIKWAAVGGAVAAGATGFWVPLGIGAVVGGAYRAWKRSKDVKYDIAQELRHETLGGKASEVLGKQGERGYGKAIKSFKEALAEVAAMQGKRTFTDAEKQQLAQIYARLQLERGFLQDEENKFTKVDLFKMEEDAGKRFGTTAVDKSTLRVELKKLGISEHELQGLIDAQKGGILDIIKDANKKQESFRRKEMAKSFASGAVMGLAGGVLAQSAMNWAGEHVEHLWGGSYFHNHGTQLGQIRDWAKGSYQSHFGHGVAVGATADHAVGGMWHSRDASSHEWVDKIKDHVSGGQVEHIHTHDWYDNNASGQSATEHMHNANELKFLINKDTVGNFHFKVPVDEQGGSWVIHGNHFEPADLQKAFAEGHIKMIFVPDGSGHGAHEAITFQINPVTKELIIPPDSNIRNLFDENTGMFKGNGYFGLAEQVGVRPDGSSNYTWINSLRGNGGHVNFGQNVWQDDIRIVGPGAAEAAKSYDSFTVPTVPPQRKVFMRPEERAAKEEKKKKEDAEKAKKKAEKDANKKGKKSSGAAAGHSESGGGGGGASSQETTKKTETQETAVKAPEFKGDVLKRYTDKKYAAELLNKYNEKPEGLAKIDTKSIKFVVEGSKGLNVPVKKDMAKAVWELEQALVAAKVISQDKADEFYDEVAEPVATPAKGASEGGKTGDKSGAEGGKSAPAGKTKENVAPAETLDDAAGDSMQDTEKEKVVEERDGELNKAKRELEAEWGKKFNVKIPSTPERRKSSAEALVNLGRALNRADEQSVKSALDKKFKGREKQGLYIEFVNPGGKPEFEDGVLALPADAGPVDILKALETVGVKRKKEAEKPKTPPAPTGQTAKQEAPKVDEKEELKKKTSEVIKHFKAEADKAGLTPGARAMFDKLLADALPDAIKENPNLAELLKNIPIDLNVRDKSSDKVTNVTYIIGRKILRFTVGGTDDGYNSTLEKVRNSLETISLLK